MSCKASVPQYPSASALLCYTWNQCSEYGNGGHRMSPDLYAGRSAQLSSNNVVEGRCWCCPRKDVICLMHILSMPMLWCLLLLWWCTRLALANLLNKNKKLLTILCIFYFYCPCCCSLCAVSSIRVRNKIDAVSVVGISCCLRCHSAGPLGAGLVLFNCVFGIDGGGSDVAPCPTIDVDKFKSHHHDSLHAFWEGRELVLCLPPSSHFLSFPVWVSSKGEGVCSSALQGMGDGYAF